MATLSPEDDLRLVSALGRQFYLGRCSSYQPTRYGIIHQNALRAELAVTPASNPVRRARLLRLLGETKEAARLLAGALRKADAPAAAHAYHWEMGLGGAAALDRAVALEPRRGAWRLWRALDRLGRGEQEQALADAKGAAGLMPGHALPPLIAGLIEHHR
ncbi:MAG: hypothetical protein COV48_04110, partial [Elusimicrobia bacterium CG11_big_fil_rev_8_21_14_0_20_64_6]